MLKEEHYKKAIEALTDHLIQTEKERDELKETVGILRVEIDSNRNRLCNAMDRTDYPSLGVITHEICEKLHKDRVSKGS